MAEQLSSSSDDLQEFNSLRNELLNSLVELADATNGFHESVLPSGIEGDYFQSDFDEVEEKFEAMKITFITFRNYLDNENSEDCGDANG
jgi:hypothetical protein